MKFAELAVKLGTSKLLLQKGEQHLTHACIQDVPRLLGVGDTRNNLGLHGVAEALVGVNVEHRDPPL